MPKHAVKTDEPALSHKDRTRARILDEAASALRQEGISGIGVADLMKRAGLTHGGFYAHFASRDDLVAHAIDRMFVDSNFCRNRPLDHDDPAVGLAAFIDGYLSDKAWAHPEHACPIPSLISEAPHMPSEARTRFAQGITAVRAALAVTLKKLGHKETKTLAGSVLAEIVGAMAIARALPDEADATALLTKTRQDLKSRLIKA